ncbi:MAG: DUF2484 family protein [Gemmobacter sp.]
MGPRAGWPGGSRRLALCALMLVGVPVLGWVTLRFGPQSGLVALGLCGAALCLAAARGR